MVKKITIRSSTERNQHGDPEALRLKKKISGEKITNGQSIWPKKNQRVFADESNMPVIIQNKNSILPTSNHGPHEVNSSLTKLVQRNWRVLFIAVISIFMLTTSIKSTGTYNLSDETLHTNGHVQGRPSFSIDTSFENTDGPFRDLSPGENVRLSKSLQMLADIDDLPLNNSDIPFFFHVPRSGGSTVKDILGSCIGFVQASDVGARHGHKHDKALQVMQDTDGSHFVNVDTTTAEGIHRAKKLGLVQSGLADVIVTQHLHPAATMFNENQRGRMFTLIRHPIERAVSLFHYLGVADWEPTYDPDLNYVSIEMWARSRRIEHNWMTRFLSNELERDLTPKHLEVAKEVLRKKCLIGLLEQKGESFYRFEKYFGWEYPNKNTKECKERLLHWGWSNKHTHNTVEEGSPAWELLTKKNDFDMHLYEYAKQLFREQARIFHPNGGNDQNQNYYDSERDGKSSQQTENMEDELVRFVNGTPPQPFTENSDNNPQNKMKVSEIPIGPNQ